MQFIKKLIKIKNSETFRIIVKIVSLLFRLFNKSKNNGNYQEK